MVYRFEEFEFDDANFRLSRDGVPVQMEPKALRLLLYLLENPNRLVRKQELLDYVWPEANVGENALARAVGLLRKALGEDTRVPRFIETVPTLGYRFIAPVTVAGAAAPAYPPADPPRVERTASAPSTQPPEKSGGSRASRIVLASAIAAAAVVGVAVWITPARVSGPLDATQITSSSDLKQGLLFTDGLRLYFYSQGEPAEMAVSGGIIAPAHIFGPTFHLLDISADGSKALARLAQNEDESGRGTLWVESTLGGAPHKVSDRLALTARWAPDGHSIVFGDQQTIYRIDEDGQHMTKIWDAPGTVMKVSYSPDARLLSATVDRGTPFIASPQLWQLDSGGGNAHPLDLGWPENANATSGQWTPDGKHFVFLSDREGLTNVYELVSPRWFEFWKKPTVFRLSGNQLGIEGMAPARDSKSLFVLERPDQGAIQALDAASGRLRALPGRLGRNQLCPVPGPPVDGVYQISIRPALEVPSGWQRENTAHELCRSGPAMVARRKKPDLYRLAQPLSDLGRWRRSAGAGRGRRQQGWNRADHAHLVARRPIHLLELFPICR